MLSKKRFRLVQIMGVLLIIVSTGTPVWAEIPIDILEKSDLEKVGYLDGRNRDRDSRVTLSGLGVAETYNEGLLLVRAGNYGDGLSKLEKVIEVEVKAGVGDPFLFNDLTHRYMGLVVLLTGLERPSVFFKQLADNYPDVPWAQVTYAAVTLRIKGLHTMGIGLRKIKKALQIDPTNLFARMSKALALSYLPFGFDSAEREWKQLQKDTTIPPEATRIMMAFQRQMYLLHGHKEKAATINVRMDTARLDRMLTSMLAEESLHNYNQALEAERGGNRVQALDYLEKVIWQSVDQPSFSLLFGRYLSTLRRDNKRGAKFFEQLGKAHPESPHALAAYGFYTHIVDGSEEIEHGLKIIDKARKQMGQSFGLDLVYANQLASMPGKLSKAYLTFEGIISQYQRQLPHATWIVQSHVTFLQKVHGVKSSTYWESYDPWIVYTQGQSENVQGCSIYISWN